MTPGTAVVLAVLALAIAGAAVGLLRYADQLEHREAQRQAALAKARRDVQRRDFDVHVATAFDRLDSYVDWPLREREVSS